MDCATVEDNSTAIEQKLNNLPDSKIAQYHKEIIQNNPLLLVENGHLKIQTKDINGADVGLAKLYPNQPQRRFLQLFKNLQAAQKPIRIIILKARQWGGTTITEAITYAYTSQKSNVRAMIIADDGDGAGYILNMARTMHEEIRGTSSYLVPKDKRSNRNELAFDETRSYIFITSAEKRYAGQKYTLQYLHCSEVSKFHYTDSMFAGLLPAVPDLPGTFIVLESTANGVGDFFHRKCKEAEENTKKYGKDLNELPDGEFVLFFVPWMEHEEYSKSFRTDEAKQEFMATLTDREKSLLEMSYQTIDGMQQITPEQLNWRRWTIKQKSGGDEDAFNEMYPATIDEAFLVSGRPRFNAQRLTEMYNYAVSCEYRQGTLNFPSTKELAELPGARKDRPLFHPDPRGEWHIWEMPDWRCEYVIAVDTAGGEEIEGTSEGKKGDYNCIQVFKRPTFQQNGDGVLTQVAEYRGRIDPDLLADEAFMAHLAYNQPIIFVEVNNHGRTTIDHLKNKCPVFRREELDPATRRVIGHKLGWYTDKNTKKQMIDTLAEAIRDGWIVVRSTVLAGELRTYVRASDGTTNAQEGCFDDTVMACALAVQANLRAPLKDAYKVVEMRNKAMGGRS